MHKHAVILLLLITIKFSLANISKCNRMPEGTSAAKSPPDGRFRLRIINDPIRFIPGESYNISLEGVTRHSALSPQKFIGFFLTVERNDDKNSEEDLGRFQILQPAISKISEKCNNLVVNTNTGAKPEVLVQWTAPSKLKGCIVFRSTIVEHRDIWFMDDGALSQTLCEDEADSYDLEPLILPECKACEEAKYELTFEGLWSRNTHPKDFPDDRWLTKFSDVIGASHAIDSTFWRYGDHSTQGMKDMAEHGATQELELELKEKGENIRTIIKARGISYPNINGKTFAVFRADNQHHLLSLVSKIYPSPDWFVGVSDLELCLENGQWIEEKIVNLYPYDAGTDSGPTYTSSDQPTLPREAIRRIKPNNPNDPRSPFYDAENKEMKPLAKLYITRQRLYEKACENNDNESDDNEDNKNSDENEEDDNREQYCETTAWRWSKCNCDNRQKSGSRQYKYPQMAYEKGCQEQLQVIEDCTSQECPSSRDNNFHTNDDDDKDEVKGDSTEEKDLEAQIENDSECPLSDWKEDEECSCDNGQGQKKSTRNFKRNKKICQRKYPTIELEKMESCDIPDCDENNEETTTQRIGVECPYTDWSVWTECSSDCGRGQRIRVRKPKNQNLYNNENIKEFVDLYNKIQKRKHNKNDALNLEITTVLDPDHKCYKVEFVQVRPCGRREACEEEDSYICHQPPMRGDCGKPPEIRFYYSLKEGRCGMFLYTGCEGSKNVFDDYLNCQATCEKSNIDAAKLATDSLVYFDQLKEKTNCEVSSWKYTPCNATCGEGYRWKYRQIIKRAENGGKSCPTKLRMLEKCRVNDDCEPVRTTHRTQVIRTTTQRTSAIHCEYSSWSNWSPCSKTCGNSAVQIRTRSVLNNENYAYCIDRLQERPCLVLPCLVENYNYRTRGYN
ncbi:hypothetical protein PVAND_006944 [Polypedilum vanderplanki]|uniref:Spondin-1 n=1 Tax=Polypedilum vanderplanki TaxID=319348 RepID=A0A9J6C5Q2_POLVA|nr:hypothetical protein PVAND_006944 [Polypedilum vanderplanki]